MTGEIHMASNGGDTGAVLTLDVPNVPPGTLDLIRTNGLIEVSAGYQKVIGGELPPPSVIFFGSVDVAYMSREGSKDILHIEATSNPSRITDNYVALASPRDPTATGFTYGYAMRYLFERIGGRILLPKSFDEHFLYDYVSTGSVLDEARKIIEKFNHEMAVARSLGAVSDPLRRVEMVQSPLSGAGQFTYAVVNVDGSNEYGFLAVDLDNDDVYHATPVVSRGQQEKVFVGDELDIGPDAVDEGGSTLEFRLVTPLDPRKAMGLLVEMTGGGNSGEFVITDLIHDLGAWQTQSQGPFRRTA